MPPKKTKRVSIDPKAGNTKPSYRMHRDAKKSFQAKFDDEHAVHMGQVTEIQAQIDAVRKENEKIVRQQNLRFGTTLDDIRFTESELENAKTTNQELFKEMELKRTECGKLESTLDGINKKMDNLLTELNYFKKERRMFSEETERLNEAEAICLKVSKSNRDIRLALVKNHVDPDVRCGTRPARRDRPSGPVPRPVNIGRQARRSVSLHGKTSQSMEDIRTRRHRPALRGPRATSNRGHNPVHLPRLHPITA